MSNKIEVFIPSAQVSQFVLELSELEDIGVQIAASTADRPDDAKKHPSYSIPELAELVPIIIQLSPTIIAVAGLASSLVGLASTILKYKQDAKQIDSSSKQSKSLQILIDQRIITINNYSDANDLAAYIKDQLTRE